MYLTYDTQTYTALNGLTFRPQVDLTNSSLPINEFTVDVYTDDEITAGQYAELYDDLDTLWAKYRVMRAVRVAPHVVRVYARSDLQLLDDVTLPEIMYDGDALVDIMDNVMVCSVGAGLVATIPYALDSTLEALELTGYCPEQTARERLQWICMVTGAYVKSFFNDETEILPIGSTARLIPLNRTFWRPSVSMSDYVSAVRVTQYAFTQGLQTEGEILDDNTSYPFPLPWVADEAVIEVENTATWDADNIVEVDGVYLINQGNVSGLLGRLTGRYFKRTTVDLDVIDNGEYLPGERVIVYANANTLYEGNIESAAFRFGRQARATLHLSAAEEVEGAELTVTYVWQGMTVALETYVLPVGYAYSISTRYIDMTLDGHRYILRPTTGTITGTMTSEGAAVTVTCETALDLYEGVLHIYDVDDFSVDVEGVVTIE